MLHCSSTWRRYHSDLIAHLSREYQHTQSIVFHMLDLGRLLRFTVKRLTTVTMEVRCRCWPPLRFTTLSCFSFSSFTFIAETPFRTQKRTHMWFLCICNGFVRIANGGARIEKETDHFSQNYCSRVFTPPLTRRGSGERGLCVIWQEMWFGSLFTCAKHSCRSSWITSVSRQNNTVDIFQMRRCCVVLIMYISIRTQECRFGHYFSFLKEHFLCGAN